MTDNQDADVKDKGLYPRGTVWWGRVVVPKELRAVFGKGPLRKTLETSDRNTARLRLAEYQAQTLREFAEARRRLNPTKAEATPELAAQVAQEVRRWVLEADENARSFPGVPRALLAREERRRVLEDLDRVMATPEGQALSALLPAASASSLVIGVPSRPRTAPAVAPKVDPLAGRSEAEADAMARFNAAHAADIGKANRLDALRDALPLAQAVSQDMGLAVDWTTPDGLKGLKQVLAAYATATAEATRRDAGEFIHTPAPVKPKEAPEQVTLEDMRAVWEKAESNRPPDTLRKMQRACGRLSEFLERSPVVIQSVTHAEADDFRSWLLNRGNSAKTAKDMLDFIKLLYALARKRRTITEDPFAEVTIKAPKSTARVGWTIADLKELFSAPLFTQYAIPRSGDSEAAGKAGLDAAYWVPILCLYTGARVSEMCQLRTVDVLEVEGEEDPGQTVPVIDITEGAADEEAGTKARRTKTTTSVRRVPVHPTLLALGFMEYVQAIRDAGHPQLFPAVISREGAPAGEYVSTWFSAFKRSLGFSRWDDLHNMRHTMRTRLTLAQVKEGTIDALAGHASGGRGSEGRRTYLHARTHPQATARALALLTYPGLDLPKVFKAPVWKP